MIRVVIVDDDNDNAEALMRNINNKEGIQVVDIFNGGKEASEHCYEKHPDIILMDVRMPDMDGIEASRLIKQKDPTIKILILTLFSERDSMIKAVKNNCDGFLFKGRKSEEIIAIIKNTYKGLNTFENEVQAAVHEQIYNSAYQFQEANQHAIHILTAREKDIVRLITAGKKDNEIAAELFLSEGYLRNKLVEIREKLGLRNSRELAVWGAKMGL